ncbi:FeoB small GTPase domain-containing protein [candidate division KSB1 bacterium]
MSGTEETAAKSERTSSVILVGNPNVGKSVVFGYLTGKYVNVSNYPGTTVEISRGRFASGDSNVTVTDTPGANSFIPQSEDEEVSRNVLLQGSYDSVIQIADSKNLRRSLLITLQLAEMDIPFILVQNMSDEANIRGISININELERILGIPVLSATATQRKGLPQLKKLLLSPRKSGYRVVYPDFVEKGIQRIEYLLSEAALSKRSLAIMLLAGDSSLFKWLIQNVSDYNISEINAIINDTQNKSDAPPRKSYCKLPPLSCRFTNGERLFLKNIYEKTAHFQAR